MELFIICPSLLAMWLIKKYVFSEKEKSEPFSTLIYKANVCHCKLWHTGKDCYGFGADIDNVDGHLSPEVRAAYNSEIAKAFKSVQKSVNHSRMASYTIPFRYVSAESLLRHALNQITGGSYLAEQVKQEHTFVANCLKDAWPFLAPKLDPGRAFVQEFCQNLKANKDLFYSVIEEQHSLYEYLVWVTKKYSLILHEVKEIISSEVALKAAKLHGSIEIFSDLSKGLAQKISKAVPKSKLLSTLNEEGIQKTIAIDTEMVGAGPKGSVNMLARISLVDKDADCIYDKFVKPTRPVTDYRTFVSGISAKDLINAEDFKTVQREVAELVKNRILVGHDLEKDLNVLGLEHPSKDKRDTAMYVPFRKVAHEKPSLKYLAKQFLGRNIQTGEHSSVEDARAAMALYRKVAGQWDLACDLNVPYVSDKTHATFSFLLQNKERIWPRNNPDDGVKFLQDCFDQGLLVEDSD